MSNRNSIVYLLYELTCGRGGRRDKGVCGMTRYLISFGAHAMDHIPDEDMPAVAKAAHATVRRP